MRIVPATSLDRAALLALNNAHAVELSHATQHEFNRLLASAFHAVACAAPPALLIAFDENSGVDGPNYAWFKARYRRFVYIDRVVIAPEGRRQGVASALYTDLFHRARTSGHDCIGCEVNSDPPNPASDAFHARLGFREVGRAHLADRGKTVRYLLIAL
jgi:uncharacterized protein